MNAIDLAERGFLPDFAIRAGIRRMLARRLHNSAPAGATRVEEDISCFSEKLRHSPLAVETDTANQQHYEVPAEFFMKVLGPRLKYSSGYFASEDASLADAEDEMLRRTCERAELSDGANILELGCGWGSLTLWMAEHFPESQITAVSNSNSQREFIEQRARERGLVNVRVITADMRDFSTSEVFDRIVSVEMFEHMRNYELLFRRVSNWLTPEGRLFVHIFCHRDTPYLFEENDSSDWMSRHFFSGGTMPSENLFRQFDKHLSIEQQWRVNGLH